MVCSMVLYIVLSLLFINKVFSADCGSIYTKSECNSDSQCEWTDAAINCQAFNGNNECDLCNCKSSVPLDIVFALDSSGSIGPSNFELQRGWLRYIFNNQISPNSRIAFIIFATEVNGTANPHTEPLDFWPVGATAGDRALMTPALIEFVNNIEYTYGWTITQKAIDLGLFWFQEYGIIGRKRLLILITDGQPNRPVNNYTVCIHTPKIAILGVQVVVVGVGTGWIQQNGPQKVGCLVNDPDDMFYVPDFNSFSSINSKFLERLCPATNDVVVTEIKPGRSDKTDSNTYSNPNVADDKWRGRFLEFWNKGKDLDLNQLRLTGFVNTGLQRTFPVTLPFGSYMVFYEETSNTEDDISCYRCTSCTRTKDCTEPTSYTWNNNANNWAAYPNDANCQVTTTDDIHQPNSNRAPEWLTADDDNRGGGRCWGATNPAIYIPCPLCSTTRNPTWGSYDCCINDTMDETDWTQRIFDTQSGVELLIDEVIYNNDNDWPVARPGYPYHLIQKTYPNEAGSNWLQSCYEWGTPGADPLDFCPPRCDTASCRAGGDTSATCSGTNGICFCTAPTYYANGISCKRIPVIGVCEALWLKINESEYVMQFKWDGVLFADKEYVLTYEDYQFGINATRATTQTAFDLTDEEIAWNGIDVPPGAVAVRVIDEAGNAVTGRETICSIMTSPPSESPTPAPTSPPTPAPSGSPTPSPVAPPRACFWKNCESNPEDLRGQNFCECSAWNSQSNLFPWGFDENCCSHNGTVFSDIWDVNRLGVGRNTGDRFGCEYQDVNWLPGLRRLTIRCTDSPTIRSIIRWKIAFIRALCLSGNCLERRRLSTNNSNDTNAVVTDVGGFSLTPTEGEVEINETTIPPEKDVEIDVAAILTVSAGDNDYISYYWAEITSCENFGDGDPICTPVYPNPVQLVVSRTEQCVGSRCGITTENKIPPYVWGIIGGLIVFLCLLAALIYLFWWKTAMAKENILEAKEQRNIEEQDLDGDMGQQLGTGDIAFNPLATGNGAHQIASNPVGKQMDKLRENGNNEFAEVQERREVFREEFGQQRGGNPNGNGNSGW